MKKIFLTCCLLCLFTYAFAEKQPSLLDTNEVTLKFGKILSNDVQYESIADNTFYISDHDSKGIVVKLDYIYYLANYTGIGLGLSYTDNTANNYDPVTPYIIIKQMCPVATQNHDNKIYLYVGGAFGYGITSKEQTYILSSSDKYTLQNNGGPYWNVFAGIDINSFIVDLSLSETYFRSTCIWINGIYEGSDKNYITYTTLSLSVGYKFNFKL
ncbi:MAG: hypothetical protein VB017_07480 [Endomicrobiaceae bacterium]|jgi:hypothetical protein|nr:hypothetical protein [Endomicrobiaceae bacterium]